MARKDPITKRLTSIGYTTLVTQTETNISIANCALVLDGRVEKSEFAELLGNPNTGLLLSYRFRSAVVGMDFVELPDFSVEKVISELTIPEGTVGDLHEQWLLDWIGEHCFDPFKEGMPMWEAIVCHGYQGSKTLLVLRVHHCLADGMSFAGLFLGMSDQVQKMKQEAAVARAIKPSKPTQNVLSRLGSTAVRAPIQILQFCGLGMGCILVLAKQMSVMVVGEPSTPLKGPLGLQKNLAMGSGEIPAALVSEAGKRVGATYNDMMLAATSLALRRWLEGSGAKIPSSLTCAIPVNLRTTDEEYIGNKIGAFTVKLPVSLSDPVKCIRCTSKRAKTAKTSPEALLAYWLGRLSFLLPTWLAVKLMEAGTRNVSLCQSNVRMPDMQLTMKGHKVEKSYAGVPPPPGVALGILGGSNKGFVEISAFADSRLLGKTFARDFVVQMEEELLRLCAACKALPNTSGRP